VNRYTEIHSVSDSQADTHQIHTQIRAIPSSRNGLLDSLLVDFSPSAMQHRTPWNPNPDRAKRSGAATAPAETRVIPMPAAMAVPEREADEEWSLSDQAILRLMA
jgi:hypothetical protein